MSSLTCTNSISRLAVNQYFAFGVFMSSDTRKQMQKFSESDSKSWTKTLQFS